MADGTTGSKRVFLSLHPASRGERRLAWAVVGISLLGFALAAPFARTPLPRIEAFIPTYQSALTLNDLITAVLLFGQYSIDRSRGLLLLASGYLFTALMVVAHTLSFPGLFSPTGLMGAGPQTTAWLYMFWHGGFPIMVMGYAVGDGIAPAATPVIGGTARAAILKSILAVIACVVGIVLLTTAGQALLPAIMVGSQATSALRAVVSIVLLLNVVALVLLWRRKPHSVLDLWLIVAQCAWLMDIALSALLNAGRFDLGFYVGRIYGLMAVSFVLMLLLLETRALYARLAQSLSKERVAADQRTKEVQTVNLALRESEQRLQGLNETLEQRVRERSQQLEAEITERARTLEALRESQKLEAIGRMAGGIAHDFNNLLTVILGNAEFLQQGSKPPADIHAAHAIDQAAERGIQLIRQILAFSRKQALNPELVDLRLRDKDLSEMLGRAVRGDVQIMINLADDLWPVECDVGELELALMNLCINARDAMPAGGLVQLTGQNRSLAAHQDPNPANISGIVTGISDLTGEFVALTLSDTGAGIAPDHLKRVFEPFFTTKEVGKGTGLGLSQVYGFAQQSGGRAAIESEIGQGTSVTIYLPRATARGNAPTAEDRAVTQYGAGTILLVEDDEDVAKMALRMLAMIGYQGHHVLDARTALTLLLGGQHFDLLFSDIVMPGDMNGLDLARKVRQHFPRLPILLATGYSRAAAEVHRDGFTIIAKPYRADALAAAIASELRQRAVESSQDTA